jgi:hypothetical protein
MDLSNTREATYCEVTQKLPKILWNSKARHRIHNSSPLVPILILTNPVSTSHPTSPRSILILFTHLCLDFPSGLFPFGFPTNNL